MDSQELRSLQEAYLDVYTEDRDGYGDKFTQDTDADKFIPGKSVPKVKTFGRPFGKYAPGKIILNDILKKLPAEEKKKPSREIVRKNLNNSYDLYDIILSHLLDEGYAETQEAAEAIMVNMSEEWIGSIIG